MGWTHIDTLLSSTADASVPKEHVEISNEIDKVSTITSSERDTLSNETEAKEKEKKMVWNSERETIQWEDKYTVHRTNDKNRKYEDQ